jgi:hypothetical protein
MSDLSNDTKKHTTKSRETIPLKAQRNKNKLQSKNVRHAKLNSPAIALMWKKSI